jgi:hypothetical protein
MKRILLIFLLTILGNNTAWSEEPVMRVKIIEIGDEVFGVLSNLKTSAENQGLNRMQLIGKVDEKSLPANRKQIDIHWDKAKLGESDIYLQEPLESSVIVFGDGVKEQEEFSLLGDPEVIVQAWVELDGKELQAENSAERKEDEFSEDTLAESSNTTGAATPSTPEQQIAEDSENSFKDVGTNFSAAKDPVVGSERCDIVMAKDKGLAEVYEQAYIDGEKHGSCTKGAEVIVLGKRYDGCDVQYDFETEKVFKQYKYGYKHPDTGEWITDDICQPEEESVYEMAYITDECGLRPNFTSGYSEQLVKIVYYDDQGLNLIRDCSYIENKSEKYSHVSTRNGCDPIFEDSKVTFQSKKTITVSDVIQTVSDCTPEEGGTVDVFTEVCGSKTYDHDYTANTSYKLVSYYYMDGSKKTLVPDQNCVRSEEVFDHFSDTSECTHVNDDSQKTTQLFAKIFIGENNSPTGTKTYISDCQQEGEPIPYVKTSNRWKINTSIVEYLQVPEEETGQCSLNNWITTSGKTLSKEQSDETPYFPVVGANYEWGCRFHDGRYENTKFCYNCSQSTANCPHGGEYVAYVRKFSDYCGAPNCSATTLNLHPVYRRNDGSEYYDTTTTVDQLSICGSGSSLNNQPG